MLTICSIIFANDFWWTRVIRIPAPVSASTVRSNWTWAAWWWAPSSASVPCWSCRSWWAFFTVATAAAAETIAVSGWALVICIFVKLPFFRPFLWRCHRQRFVWPGRHAQQAGRHPRPEQHRLDDVCATRRLRVRALLGGEHVEGQCRSVRSHHPHDFGVSARHGAWGEWWAIAIASVRCSIFDLGSAGNRTAASINGIVGVRVCAR